MRPDRWLLWHKIRGHQIEYRQVTFVYASYLITHCSCGAEWQQ